MIKRDGDQITITISVQHYDTLLIALGYAMGAVMKTHDPELLAAIKDLLRAINQE